MRCDGPPNAWIANLAQSKLTGTLSSGWTLWGFLMLVLACPWRWSQGLLSSILSVASPEAGGSPLARGGSRDGFMAGDVRLKDVRCCRDAVLLRQPAVWISIPQTAEPFPVSDTYWGPNSTSPILLGCSSGSSSSNLKLLPFLLGNLTIPSMTLPRGSWKYLESF